MSIEVCLSHERSLDAQAVCSLYTRVDWWPLRTEQEMACVLCNHLAVGAWDADRLIGFARVVSDGHFRAFIEDVVVHPSYQRMGIGRVLLTKLIEALPHIETITLFCEPDLVPFYTQQGFQVYPSQRVMHRKSTLPHHTDKPT